MSLVSSSLFLCMVDYNTALLSPYTDEMSFFERVGNVFMHATMTGILRGLSSASTDMFRAVDPDFPDYIVSAHRDT